MSWDNWGFGGRTSRAQAAQDFLNNGTVNTIFGGSGCRSSQDCASGFACVGGKCVQKSSQESPDGGSTCGEGTGGGGCNVTVTQGMTEQDAANRGFSWSGGVGTKSFQWVPIYAADGCTVTGCSLSSCGGGNDNEPDCPVGQRSCRYDAYGTVNCFCGPPEPQGCSRFCTNYYKSVGEIAPGCDDLTCDECEYCDYIFVSATGECKPLGGGAPCHCDPGSVPACYKCNKNGVVVEDFGNCFECVTINNFDCGCDISLSKTCCQPYGTPGLTLMNKCQIELAEQCAEECPPGATDPCAGDCITKTICQPGSCPAVPPNEPGKRNTQTGCIEAGGEGCTLYTECNMTNVPDYCEESDCNCHNDCPNCELCGADGKCYPDPSCDETDG